MMMTLKKSRKRFSVAAFDKKKPRSFGGRGSFCSMFPSESASSGPRLYDYDDDNDRDARNNLMDHEFSPAVKTKPLMQ
jgi:hypothetical protein